MKLTGYLADDCPNSDICPRIIDTDGDSVLVQGSTVTTPELLAELNMPAHESAVQVPRSLIYGIRVLDIPEMLEWIGAHHTRDLFRLEARRAYAVTSDGDDYRRYLNGEAEPNADAKTPWLERLKTDTRAGRIRRKVHVVHGALSAYERYEFEWGFAYNVTAGENIRILQIDSPHTAKRLRALGDFSVLDHEHVLRNLYNPADQFLGGQIVYGGEAAALRAITEWLWGAAVPFTAWWEDHPQYHRDQAA